MYIYYPSCNFQKLFPETAKKVRAYIETQPDVKIAGCCHKTADAPQAGDVIVTVCMSCMRGLDEVRADISLFERLLTREDFSWPDLRGQVFTLQDCFRARGKHDLHRAVRECLNRTGATVVEMPMNRDEETYDGTFLLHAPLKDSSSACSPEGSSVRASASSSGQAKITLKPSTSRYFVTRRSGREISGLVSGICFQTAALYCGRLMGPNSRSKIACSSFSSMLSLRRGAERGTSLGLDRTLSRCI